MAAAQYNITIDAQSDFSRTFAVEEPAGTPVDITGYSFTAQIREHFTQSEHTDFTTSIVDASQGLFKIVLTDTVTGAMSPGKQYYDIVMTSNTGEKTRLLQGDANIAWGITR